MTGVQFKELANAATGLQLTDTNIVNAIQEALLIIGDKARIVRTITAELAEIWYDLPANLTSVLEVTSEENHIYLGWQQEGQRIKFQDAGTYRVAAKGLPEEYTNANETPDLHPAFNAALLVYCKAYGMLHSNPNSPAGLRHKAEFERLVLKAEKEISYKSPTRWKVVRRG